MIPAWRQGIVAAAVLCFAASAQATITISPSTLPNWTVNAAYSQTLSGSGCLLNCTWSISAGALPTGLSLGSSNGVISGTPSATGTFQFTVTVATLLDSGSQAYTVVINSPPAIITSSLGDGTVNQPYSQSVVVSDGTSPYTFSVSAGSLPAGLSLNASSGLISGTPTNAGSSNFTINVSDAASASTSRPLAITVGSSAPALSITSTSPLPAGTAGKAYSQTLAATGGKSPYSWSVTSGSLPGGLSLDAASGKIGGTPATAGTFTFTVQVADSAGSKASQPFALVINSNTAALSITTASTLPGGTVGKAYSQTLSATGGTSPYSWSVTSGSLPAGLGLDAGSGKISGTPLVPGTSNFTVQVSDSASGKASQPFSLTITLATAALSITTASPLPGGTVGTSYSQTLTATGGIAPYTWSVTGGSLPGGISLGSSTGTLAGTPTSAATSTFTVQVTDSTGANTSKPFSLTIGSGGGALSITIASTLPSGTIGTQYLETLTASGGSTPYTWTVTGGALPGGLALNSSGVITGIPIQAGSFSFTVEVSDAASHTAQKQLSLTTTSDSSSGKMKLTGVPETAQSGQQITLELDLNAPASQPITGQVTLSFKPDAVVNDDDPAIQFSSGGRTATFTFPPNSTRAVFPVSPMGFQTGTVAGTISLSFSAQSNGATLSTKDLDRTVTVASAVATIGSATVVKNSSGFQVQVAGFSNTREIDSITFHFSPASGQSLQTTDLKVILSDIANQWFTSGASMQFGGQFLLMMPFTLQQGTISEIGSVEVRIQNAQGASDQASANF